MIVIKNDIILPMNQQDYNSPVAYDAQGRPLYAHPPEPTSKQSTTNVRSEIPSHVTNAAISQDGYGFDPVTRVQLSNEPDVRHMIRPVEPSNIPLSDQIIQKHESSKRLFPTLNLSSGEHVLLVVHRHPIGLAIPIITTAIVLILILALVVGYPFFMEKTMVKMGSNTVISYDAILLISSLFAILVSIFGYIAVWIYQRNRFFLTNESVIQEIQTSLFARHEQTVSLGSIEDVSFKKVNILETIFDFGTIRLSTEGEETTYKFHYVENPKKQVAILNDAVEAFKNGRPVSLSHDN